MNASLPQVMVIDDDASVRRSLLRLLETEGYAVDTFSSAASTQRRMCAGENSGPSRSKV